MGREEGRRPKGQRRDADLRVRAPEGAAGAPSAPPPMPRDPRLPPAGSTLKRLFNGKEHLVRVLDSGFEYEGRTFESLSAVARAIAGTRWNGFLFFNLGEIDGRGR